MKLVSNSTRPIQNKPGKKRIPFQDWNKQMRVMRQRRDRYREKKQKQRREREIRIWVVPKNAITQEICFVSILRQIDLFSFFPFN